MIDPRSVSTPHWTSPDVRRQHIWQVTAYILECKPQKSLELCHVGSDYTPSASQIRVRRPYSLKGWFRCFCVYWVHPQTVCPNRNDVLGDGWDATGIWKPAFISLSSAYHRDPPGDRPQFFGPVLKGFSLFSLVQREWLRGLPTIWWC